MGGADSDDEEEEDSGGLVSVELLKKVCRTFLSTTPHV